MQDDVYYRFKELEAAVENSNTPEQFHGRAERMACIKRHVQNSNGDDEKAYAEMVSCWACLVAFEFNSKEGVPLIYSPWQVKASKLCEVYDDVFLLTARQVGKSLFAATEIMRRMMQHPNRNVLLIAPTMEQLIVRDEFNRLRDGSKFVQDFFMKDGPAKIETTGFGANGSTFHAINLAMKSEGSTKVGNTGTDLVCDEIQNFTAKSWEESIAPMLSSAFVKRRLLRIGTVKLRYRPDLEKVWLQAQNNDYTGTMNVNCWDAVQQGIRLAKYDPLTMKASSQSMAARFADLNIQCPAVLQNGACPVMLPNWYDVLEQNGVRKRGNEWAPGEYRCPYNEICLRNTAFATEDLAAFPSGTERFFPQSWLMALRRPYRFYTPREVSATTRPIYFGMDTAGLVDEGQIMIGERINEGGIDKIKVIGHQQIEPYAKPAGPIPSHTPTIEMLKKLYAQYLPRFIYLDSTSNFEMVSQLITEPLAIPKSVIFANKPSQNRGTLGVYFSPMEKSRIYENHRVMVATERIVVPDENGEPDYWAEFFESHLDTRLRSNSVAGYSTFEPHARDHFVDAMALLSMALIEDSGAPPIYDMEAIQW